MNSIPLSISEEMHLLAQQLQHHFSPTQLEDLARKAGFVQRKSKYTAQDLVSLCVFLNDHLSVTPLVRLCSQLDASNHLSMSTEGLNQRFNPSAVAFLQSLFSSLLQEKISARLPSRCLVNVTPIFIESVFWIRLFFNFQIPMPTVTRDPEEVLIRLV
ncbi:hypothetical protein ACVLD2_000974 [Paenibacillus sp. PvR052]|nr:hypothetical protein [Paenibacillus sp. PvP091]MBP1169496.1 hypothetical protein [Paenibacillus sp. PvR098]MBP2440524.1 hypothetical protein [Paenibacillus sp. PvP052]